MATIVNTNFETTCLTSNLPEVVEIETDAARLEVNIFIGNVKVFKSVYYPFNSLVSVRDIRSIIEAALFEQHLVMATLKIEVYEPKNNVTNTQTVIDENGNYVMTFGSDGSASPDATVEDVKVVYCRFKTGSSSSDFLRERLERGIIDIESCLLLQHESEPHGLVCTLAVCLLLFFTCDAHCPHIVLTLVRLHD